MAIQLTGFHIVPGKMQKLIKCEKQVGYNEKVYERIKQHFNLQ